MKKKLICIFILCTVLLSACEQKHPESKETNKKNIDTSLYLSTDSNTDSDGEEYSLENVLEDLGNGFYTISDYSAEERASNGYEDYALVFLNAQNKIKVIHRYNRYLLPYGTYLGSFYLNTEDAIYYMKDGDIYKVSKSNPYDNKFFYSFKEKKEFLINVLVRYEDHKIVCGGDYNDLETGHLDTAEAYLADDGSGEYHLSILE